MGPIVFWQSLLGGGNRGEGLRSEETLVSSGGRLPSGTEIGEGGYHGETYGAEHADRAYKGLGGTGPPHSRALSTTLSACYALRDISWCCNHLSFFLSRWHYARYSAGSSTLVEAGRTRLVASTPSIDSHPSK